MKPPPQRHGLWSAMAAVLLAPSAGILVSKAPSLAQEGATDLPEFDHLRQSVIRIQAVASNFDWLHPFMPGQDGVGLGSGFVVQAKPYPLFVTNAHVISDAKKVTVQLLLYGAEQFDAEVVSVCTKFDLALLVLQDVDGFTRGLGTRNITLEPLKLADGVAAMGMDVVALGFPLGQDALKISKGNVAGNEDVDGNICIQSTAPISPGNSGGPLLDAAGREVVGVNFAKATQGENINYVIPVWRVKQMIRKHLKDQPAVPKDGRWRRVQVRVPKLELTTIAPNRPLYTRGKCSEGLYISKVGARSPFRTADPPIKEGSFLLSVNGQKLDRFGTGLNDKFVADRVTFTDLLFMVPDLSGAVDIETCFGGNALKHSVSMAWAPEYERGLQTVDEPYIAEMSVRYEMFGGVSVMQMTVNHVSAVLSTYGDPGPARWLHPDLVDQPRLVINYVQSGSYPESIFAPGSAIAKLNGVPVHTLEEFREHFEPKNGSDEWSLETDMGAIIVLDFNETLRQQLQSAVMTHSPFLLTRAVVKAAKSKGLGPGDAMKTGPAGDSNGPLVALGEASAVHHPNDNIAGPPFGPSTDASVEVAALPLASGDRKSVV